MAQRERQLKGQRDEGIKSLNAKIGRVRCERGIERKTEKRKRHEKKAREKMLYCLIIGGQHIFANALAPDTLLSCQKS